MARTWTPEDRKRQSELMHRLKPWTRSTGPRTAAGKARAAQNAYKHGFRSARMRALDDVLAMARAFRLHAMRYVRAIQMRANGLLSSADLHREFAWRGCRLAAKTVMAPGGRPPDLHFMTAA